MKTAHTPGPWVVHHLGRYPEVSTANGRETIANPVNGLANAHLIASAPDLLAALEELEPIAHRLGGEHPRFDLLNAATAKARAAIARATGGEK